MPCKHRFIGWRVLVEDLHTGRCAAYRNCASEAEARELARTLNARGERRRLFWAEYWSTTSVFDVELAR